MTKLLTPCYIHVSEERLVEIAVECYEGGLLPLSLATVAYPARLGPDAQGSLLALCECAIWEGDIPPWAAKIIQDNDIAVRSIS